MTKLLEIREQIKTIISRYEAFIFPIGKFLLAFFALSMINGRMGYMNRLDNVALVLIVALTCSFLPLGSIVFFGAIFSLAHMFALSPEVALIGICVYLIIFVMFLRFGPKDSLVVIMTPLLFCMKIPFIMPIAVGLLGGPAAVVTMGCGVLIYYLNRAVAENATQIIALGSEEAVAKIRMILDSGVLNKEIIIVIAAFAITALVVYFLRRMSMEYAWTIAIVSGALLNIIILMLGDLLYDINISVLATILGSIVAVCVGKGIEFFRFCVDYRRTERVQFEDDEYYYYVKAVPKITVAVPAKTVKRINTTVASRSVVTERTGRTGAPAQTGRTGGATQTGRATASGNRSQAGRSVTNNGKRYGGNGAKSVTINGQMTSSRKEEDEVDFEEIF